MWATEWFKMEKLIELLTEYNDNKEWAKIWFITTIHVNWVPTPYELGKLELLRWEDKIISKQYWFIKWLVENDKIDLEEVEKINQTWNIYIRFWWDYEKVLMLLSIQDEPIRFLCEIIK